MGESVVHATVVASVLASVRSIDVRMILFGTEVADVSAIATAPVDILLGAQIGGGTDIAGAVEYAAANLIRHPSRTLLVVVTDLYEGGDEDALVSRLGALNTSRCRTACVLGVSVSGRADFNERLAARLAAVGTPSFAASPDRLVDLISKLWDPMWPPAGL